MANLQTPHAAWFISRFRKAKALCVRKAATPVSNAKYLCATGVRHENVAHSEQFFESYAQVDPNVAHWGDPSREESHKPAEMSHNLDDDLEESHILDHDFDLSQINDDEALLQMLKDHDVAIPELETPKTYPRGVRFSLDEIDTIKERARAAGCSFNAYVRATALGEQYKPPMGKGLRLALLDLNRELTAHGNNINQIARHLNAHIRTPTQANQALEVMRPAYVQTLEAVRNALSYGMEEPAP